MSGRKYLDDYERGLEDATEELRPEIERARRALRNLVASIKADRAESRYPSAIADAERALRGEDDDE